MKKIYGAIMAAVVSLTIVAVAQAQTVFNVDPVKGAQVLQLILAGNFASQAAATDSSLTIRGSRFVSYTVSSASTIAAVSSHAYQTTAAAVTVTLPDATTCQGEEVYIKDNHGSSATVTMASDFCSNN